MAGGYVVDEAAVEGARAGGDTALVKVTIGAEQGSERLEQRVLRYGAGRSARRVNVLLDETMYVVAGRGTIEFGETAHALEPDTSVFVAAGEPIGVDNPGPDELVIVSVLSPTEPVAARTLVTRLGDHADQRADAKRTFRVLLDAAAGCPGLTQFVGFVEPYRAPDHSHPYDEVGYVLAGRGYAHLSGESVPIGPGSCFHLPPGEVHCIENVGPGVMRILGVFHPSDSPASRTYDAAQAAMSRGAAASPHSRAIHRGRTT
jgi:mannose-6-phosphate isomerase-like protein (cupin superfamily)